MQCSQSWPHTATRQAVWAPVLLTWLAVKAQSCSADNVLLAQRLGKLVGRKGAEKTKMTILKGVSGALKPVSSPCPRQYSSYKRASSEPFEMCCPVIQCLMSTSTSTGKVYCIMKKRCNGHTGANVFAAWAPGIRQVDHAQGIGRENSDQQFAQGDGSLQLRSSVCSLQTLMCSIRPSLSSRSF